MTSRDTAPPPLPRPWPAPTTPHAMQMRWEHLAFLHWRVPSADVDGALPAGLVADRFDGSAWVGVVPFGMEATRFRFLPPLPGVRRFPELNVRTYVTSGGKRGVWFFSLDAASRIAVRAARALFHLPYMDARMRFAASPDGVEYRSERTHRGAPPAAFAARYRATAPHEHARRGSLEEFLVERYCLYAARRDGALLRAEVAHDPWRLAAGEAELETCDMTRGLGFALEGAPVVHVAEPLDVRAWWPRRQS